MITCDEKWIHHENPQRKRYFAKIGEKGLIQGVSKKSLRTKKTMITVFWDVRGIIHHEYLPSGDTINAASYCKVLERVKQAVRQKRRWRGPVYFQQDNAKPHTAKITKAKIKELGWKLLPHPPYSPDLAPSDFHLFLSMANDQRGKRFPNEEAAKAATSAFLQEKEEKNEEFFSRGIWKLVDRWKKCISVKGEYFE